MFKLIKKLFAKEKNRKIAFLDGDQPLPGIINAYNKHLVGQVSEVHLVRLKSEDANEPKLLRKVDVNKVYLSGFTARKEVVDKFIGAAILKAVADGYTEVVVVSGDYDFIDAFKMAAMLDTRAEKVTFRLIVPKGQGRVADALGTQINNIEIVKA
jgi:uncharacterized LabA/DUF88 family protein